MESFIHTFSSTVASISPGLTLFTRQQFLKEVNNDIGDVTKMLNRNDMYDEDNYDDDRIPFSPRLTDFCCMVS